MSGDFDRSLSVLDSRLVSIETKLDRIIRVEERQNTHSVDLKRVFVRVENVETRVRELELKDSATNVRTQSNAGAITVIVSAVVSVVVGLLIWKLK
jgi:hypothetical protein